MAASHLLPFCLLLTCYAIRTGCGFNIDLRFPVVKEGKTKGSFFGFSVAQHRQTEKTKKYLLLAGAPKEKALPHLKVNETGAIYSCPITTDLADCTRVDLISSEDSTEMIEGMWLGVTVASQRGVPAGRVLACGHRYVKIVPGGTEDQWRMVGRCFVRGNDLTYDSSDDWQTHTYEVCDPNSDMDNEGMCNMGISGGMTESDVYIGCTGSYLWQGNVHVTWRDPTNSWDYQEINLGPQSRRNSYMGYSVIEEKKLLHRKEYTVVTGAPRDDSRGSVTLAKINSKDFKAVTTILGEQVGSYFGSSIAVTDLNNDDWNDLIVGAPFYFNRSQDHGGAVYVFMNENSSFQDKASVVLKGEKGSGFGLAVAAVGDINQDGFQDFAVGAPFSSESGKVYIWMGSKEGITAKYSQVIEGKSVGSGSFQTFGYSISGGMDMDGNSYPDILVGSLDDRIALLRARPVIHLSRNFTVEPKIVDTNQCKDCVIVQICFAFALSNGNTDAKRTIDVNFTIEAECGRRTPRVHFVDNKLSTYSKLLTVSGRTCHDLKLGVNDQVSNKLEPVVFLLNASLHEPTVAPQKGLQNLDTFPILSGPQTVIEKTEISFKKECGTDNRCSSNLQVKAKFANDQVPFPSQGNSQTMEYNNTMKKLALMVDVSNVPEEGREAEDAHQATLNVTIPRTLSYVGLRPQDTDIVCSGVRDCEDCSSTVLCDLGNPFKSNRKASFRLIFETAITLYTDRIETQLQLSTLSEQNDLNPVSHVLYVENQVSATFSIEESPLTTSFGGKVVGESAMKTVSDVGSPVQFKFKVGFDEPLRDLGTLMVDFQWPFAVPNGKWLLYLTEIINEGTSETRCVPPGDIVNMLNLTLEDRVQKRKRRDLESQPQADAARSFLPSTMTGDAHLECSKHTAQCMNFSCPLTNMSTMASLTLHARVWNSTMLEDYTNVAQRVIVKGNATLRLVTDKPAIKMESQWIEFTVNIDAEKGTEQTYSAPLWIYIIAGVAGILLLGVITLILWKCGFFKRASRREMYEAKAQKAEMKIQPSETERLTEDY